MRATGAGQADSPANATMATVTSSQIGANAYVNAQPDTPLVASSILPTGGSQPHYNIQPTLAVTYIISLFGIFPSPS